MSSPSGSVPGTKPRLRSWLVEFPISLCSNTIARQISTRMVRAVASYIGGPASFFISPDLSRETRLFPRPATVRTVTYSALLCAIAAGSTASTLVFSEIGSRLIILTLEKWPRSSWSMARLFFARSRRIDKGDMGQPFAHPLNWQSSQHRCPAIFAGSKASSNGRV